MTHVIKPKVLADRIFLGKELAGEGLIDNRHVARAGRIFVADHAAADQSRADGLKVMGAYAVQRAVMILAGIFGWYAALNVNVFVPVVALHGTIARKAGAQHAGDLLEPLFQLLVESRKARRRVASEGWIESDYQAALGDEAKVLVFKVTQALGEQACPNQENHGERNLQHH